MARSAMVLPGLIGLFVFLLSVQAQYIDDDCDEVEAYLNEVEGSGKVPVCPKHGYNFKTAVGVNKCKCLDGYNLSRDRRSCIPDCSDEMTWSAAEKECVCPGSAKKSADGSECECDAGLEFVDGRCQAACSDNEILKDGVCVCAPKSTRLATLGNKCYPNCQIKNMIRDKNGICSCPANAVISGSVCKCSSGHRIDGLYCVKTCATNEKISSQDGTTCDCVSNFSRSLTSNRCLKNCQFDDMVRDSRDVCHCPKGSQQTSKGCICPRGSKMKGGRCTSICATNEKFDGKTCVCKTSAFKRDSRFRNRCLPKCTFRMMKRYASSEKCQCPGFNLKKETKVLKRASSTDKGCICDPGYKLTPKGCVPMCSSRESFQNGKCVCKVGFSAFKDECLPVCGSGKLRTENDSTCMCRNGMADVDGECKCEGGRRLNSKTGQCELVNIYSSIKGNCAERTTIASQYWGLYRPDQSKCPRSELCEPSTSGYTCLSRTAKRSIYRCGTCGVKTHTPVTSRAPRGGWTYCKPVHSKCAAEFTCSKRGSNYNCVEDSQTKLTDCGQCGKLSGHAWMGRIDTSYRKRCIKKMNSYHQRIDSHTDFGFDSTGQNFCKKAGEICSPTMVEGKFPCVVESDYLKLLRKAKGSKPLNICRWSTRRKRHTLFVTPSLQEARAFKPPHKIIFMSYQFGVYKGTTVKYGHEGGWIYADGAMSKTIRRSAQKGFSHLYAWGFNRVFVAPVRSESGWKHIYRAQVQAYAVNADGSGYELGCDETRVSPIGIDLNENEEVERIDGIFHFDLDARGDGHKDYLKEWFAPTEGILIDSTIPGNLTGEHLFGDQGGQFTDGYDKLSQLKDSNKDGVIDGDELNGLKIWVDLNSNAELDGPDEIFDLNDKRLDINIDSISTVHKEFVSLASQSDGSSLMTEDLWFEENADSS